MGHDASPPPHPRGGEDAAGTLSAAVGLQPARARPLVVGIGEPRAAGEGHGGAGCAAWGLGATGRRGCLGAHHPKASLSHLLPPHPLTPTHAHADYG
jgi:hypothetical protein